MPVRLFFVALTLAAAILPQGGAAQTYPSRPIVMVVPFAAGGTFDVMGRIIAVRMSELLGQQVVFSTTTCWPRSSLIRTAMMRPMTSNVPPAANGTTMTIDREG